MKPIFLFILIISAQHLSAKTAKNAILFIGDGFGPSVVNATRVHFYGKDSNLNLDKFPHTARVKTYSTDAIVTDSAAAGTAMASGVKTKNGVIGKNAKMENVENILETAIRAGKKVAIVTTTHIFHATPAAFFAHSEHRRNNKDMGRDILKTKVDIIFGGGKKILAPYKAELRKKAMVIDDLALVKKCPKKQVIGVFSKKHIPYVYDRTKKDTVNLMNMTAKAIECLVDAPKGFVLMVEGGRIDHALHKRKIIHALFEAKEFDDTIGQSIKQLKDLGLLNKTLIMSTADHDTGGLSVNYPLPDELGFFTNKEGKLVINKSQHYTKKGPFVPVLKLNTDHPDGNEVDSGHTGVDVDLFAMGPGSEKVNGTLENTDIHRILKEGLGLK